MLHFFLVNIEELLQKLEILCFTYQHVDCVHMLLRYRFIGKIVVKSSQVFYNVQRVVSFNQRDRGVDRLTSIVKKPLKKKYRNHLLSSFQKRKSTQTREKISAERIEQVKNTNSELELIKNAHCFLDGFDSYSSHLVTFGINSLQDSLFATQRRLKGWSGSANGLVITAIISPPKKSNKQTD